MQRCVASCTLPIRRRGFGGQTGPTAECDATHALRDGDSPQPTCTAYLFAARPRSIWDRIPDGCRGSPTASNERCHYVLLNRQRHSDRPAPQGVRRVGPLASACRGIKFATSMISAVDGSPWMPVGTMSPPAERLKAMSSTWTTIWPSSVKGSERRSAATAPLYFATTTRDGLASRGLQSPSRWAIEKRAAMEAKHRLRVQDVSDPFFRDDATSTRRAARKGAATATR
jgi:hypothetical protein